MLPFDDKGRFVTRQCPDVQCGGVLLVEQWVTSLHRHWRCDGLVAHGVEPLKACTHEHTDGEPFLNPGQNETDLKSFANKL